MKKIYSLISALLHNAVTTVSTFSYAGAQANMHSVQVTGSGNLKRRIFNIYNIIILACCFLAADAVAADSWTQKANFSGGGRRGASSFVVNNIGYITLGNIADATNPNLKDDLWAYDPSANSWTQKANFPGGKRWYAIAFAAGNKGYAGTGEDTSFIFSDFYEYDPASNVWTQKANYGGAYRYAATCFSVNGKGYVGTGWDSSAAATTDFWEYDPGSDAWTQKADFLGAPRAMAVGMAIGSKGYVGTGDVGSVDAYDWWEYDPAGDSWTQKSDYGGDPRWGACGFSVNGYGFVGTGFSYSLSQRFKDFWIYDTVRDEWAHYVTMTGAARRNGVAFNIGNIGYVSLGSTAISANTNDLWEYATDVAVKDIHTESSHINVFPNPMTSSSTVKIENKNLSATEKVTFTLYDYAGKEVKSKTTAGLEFTISKNELSEGLYFYKASIDSKTIGTGKLIIQ